MPMKQDEYLGFGVRQPEYDQTHKIPYATAYKEESSRRRSEQTAEKEHRRAIERIQRNAAIREELQRLSALKDRSILEKIFLPAYAPRGAPYPPELLRFSTYGIGGHDSGFLDAIKYAEQQQKFLPQGYLQK